MPNYDRDNPKKYEVTSTHREPTTSHSFIICPFCKTEFKAYWWSIAGCGKKCPECGAIHSSTGYACKEIK